MIYGYINEFGQLTSDNFTEEDASRLNSEWKPVANIDETQLVADEENYIVKLQPYDAGDHIDFHYIKKFDYQKIKRANEQLAAELSDSDYKVIKCYEASLIGEPMPYDVEILVSSRQTIRNQINQNEILLANA
jgi:hypothetical protein